MYIRTHFSGRPVFRMERPENNSIPILLKAWAKASFSIHYYLMLSSEFSPNRVMTEKKEVKPQENIKYNIF